MAADSSEQKNALYVGDLHPDVTQENLFEIFKEVGPVVSVKIVTDKQTGKSLCYAYVTMQKEEDAKKALESLNFFPVKDRAMRIMFSERNPQKRRSNKGNIFVKGLDASIDSRTLRDTFETFGAILSAKVMTDPRTGKSRGFGFVHFESEEVAQRAIAEADGKLLGESTTPLHTAAFVPKAHRPRADPSETYNNLYVKHAKADVTVDQVKAVFGKFGEVTSTAIRNGGVAFVAFKTHEEAKRALEEMNGNSAADIVAEGKELYVARFMTKAERQVLQAKRRQERQAEYAGKPNYYVKHFSDDVTDDALRAFFVEQATRHGATDYVDSVRVARDRDGQSRGFGFVSFKSGDGPHLAIVEAVRDKSYDPFGPKPLYIAPYESKAERTMRQASQARMPMMQYGGYPAMPYAMGGMPLGMTMPMGGFPQYMMGGMPQMMVPHAYSAMPQAQRGNPPHYQQQQRGRNPPGGPPQQRRPRQAHGGRPAGGAPGTLNIESLRTMTPEEQRVTLGEQLFPRVREVVGDATAPKITGMLLDLEATDLLHMLETDAELRAKIAEAQSVLRSSAH